jgi:Ion channel
VFDADKPRQDPLEFAAISVGGVTDDSHGHWEVLATMMSMIIAASLLAGVTTVVHAVGLATLIHYLLPAIARAPAGAKHTVQLLVGVVWALLLIHVIEIAIWAVFYRAAGCLPDWEAAIYFSGVTYSTIGYGDLLLPAEWRMLGPAEGLVGILMCGLSTAFFFAIVTRMYASRHKSDPDRIP